MDLEGEGFLENRGLPQVVNKAISRGDFKWPEQFPAFGVGLVDLQHFGMLVMIVQHRYCFAHGNFLL